MREMWARWKYLPRLVALAVRLGPTEMSTIAVTSVAGGLLPVAAVAVLRILVDRTVDVIEGDGELSAAMLWLNVAQTKRTIRAAFHAAAAAHGTASRLAEALSAPPKVMLPRTLMRYSSRPGWTRA